MSSLSDLAWLSLGNNQLTSVERSDFAGIADLVLLDLSGNRLATLDSDVFSDLPNLETLYLEDNSLSRIESGVFKERANLYSLWLGGNSHLRELNLAQAEFHKLSSFRVDGDERIKRVSLKEAVLNQRSLQQLLEGGAFCWEGLCPVLYTGIGELPGVTELDLGGIDFTDITDLSALNTMDDLTDLWLVDTQNLDAVQLDALLDELDTMQATDVEGVLHMTQADFDAFNLAGGGLLAAWDAEVGHHMTIIPEPGSLVLVIIAVGWLLARPPAAAGQSC